MTLWIVRCGMGVRTVLIATDYHPAIDLVRPRLEAGGYNVVAVDGTDDLLQVCRSSGPDVVLLDPGLSKNSDVEPIEALQGDEELAIVPIVFFTSSSRQEGIGSLGLSHADITSLMDEHEVDDLISRIDTSAYIKSLQDQLRKHRQELERIASIDWLTNVWNRRMVEEECMTLISSAHRHNRSLSLMMVDVDHFKKVNDTYGHATGDAVLREVVERMQQQLRFEDRIGRWGGEEFLLLLPDTDKEGAAILGERLRRSVSDDPIDAAGCGIEVSASFGYACLTEQQAFESFVAAADNAVYQAKADGRNCVRGA